jgi:L-alanine-DL-glutamate epimerase-like enolase superfamily enzyme
LLSRFARGLKGAGDIIVPDRPGNGIDWNEDAIKRYAI